MIKNTILICLMGFFKLSFAQSLIESAEGQVFVNKMAVQKNAPVKAGDEIATGPNSRATVLYQDEAYQLRQNTVFVLPSDIKKESTSKLVAGAVLGAFTPGKPRQMKLGGNATLSIRGTGIYAEVDPKGIVHYCLCYGKSNLSTHDHSIDLDTKSKFHKDLIVLQDGTIRTPKFTERKFDHTSRQNIELEKKLDRPSPFGGGYRDFMAFFEWTL